MSAFKQVTAGDRQSVIDLALQEYGCYDGAFEIMKDNPVLDLSLHSILIPGVKVLIQTPVPRLTDTNQGVMEQYEQRHTQVVSGSASSYTEEGYPVYTPVFPPLFVPYVETGYWDAVYVKPIPAVSNLAEAININLING